MSGLRLFGRGVTKKSLNEKQVGNSIVEHPEFAKSIRSVVVADIQKELDAQKEACQSIQAEIRAERESLSKEREAQMAEFQRMSKELEAQVGKITGMQKELESQKENLIVDVVARTFVQHRKLSANIDSEMIKEAIASSILGSNDVNKAR